jgi:prepilin-type N-terminal cleavage/methylation domain-containing protein
MLRSQKSGFTLIELMVVIVIIGVLATLAIPRFTEASARAKVAEAPRVLASYESAFLAAAAETPVDQITRGHLIFTRPTSQWFTYAVVAASVTATTAESAEDLVGGAARCLAGARGGKMGSFPADGIIGSTYNDAHNTNTGGFDRADIAGTVAGGTMTSVLTRMIPNFKSDS